MAKVTVKNFNEESHHTVITSKELMESIKQQAGKPDTSVEEYYQAVFRFMLSKVCPWIQYSAKAALVGEALKYLSFPLALMLPTGL